MEVCYKYQDHSHLQIVPKFQRVYLKAEELTKAELNSEPVRGELCLNHDHINSAREVMTFMVRLLDSRVYALCPRLRVANLVIIMIMQCHSVSGQ